VWLIGCPYVVAHSYRPLREHHTAHHTYNIPGAFEARCAGFTLHPYSDLLCCTNNERLKIHALHRSTHYMLLAVPKSDCVLRCVEQDAPRGGSRMYMARCCLAL
jgi:hypothetical protein